MEADKRQKMKKIREPSQTRSIDKKKRIVQAAYELFNRKSFAEVSIRMIAREAGVSIGVIYSYFQDKTDIFIAVRDLYREELYQRFFRLMEEELDAVGSIEDGIYGVMITLRDFLESREVLHRENLILTLTDETQRLDQLERERANGQAIVDMFYRKFGSGLARPRSEALGLIIHRIIKDVVQHQVLFREFPREEEAYREIASMLAAYLRN